MKLLAALTAFGVGVTFGPPIASAACTRWDVKDTCCLAGCAAKRGSNWSKADEILRGCMRGLGCGESEVKDATVFMNCDCPEKKDDSSTQRHRSSMPPWPRLLAMPNATIELRTLVLRME